MFTLDGLTNAWPASRVGYIPNAPSHKRDPIPVLARLTWRTGTGVRSRWVPASATRWNTEFALVYVWLDETDKRTETMLWLHRTDIARALPATEPSRAPAPPTIGAWQRTG